MRAAAEQGLDHAQYHLGIMHQFGLSGLEASVDKARELFELAAEQGNDDAMFQLSCTYMPVELAEDGLDDDVLDTPLSAAMSKVAEEDSSRIVLPLVKRRQERSKTRRRLFLGFLRC